jgi:hypothetical protein
VTEILLICVYEHRFDLYSYVLMLTRAEKIEYTRKMQLSNRSFEDTWLS